MNIQTAGFHASLKYQKKRDNFCETSVLFMEEKDNVKG